MRITLIAILFLCSYQALASGDLKKIGEFNCKSSSLVFPYENPNTIVTLRLEAKIETKESELSNRSDMSKATIKMAYALRKSNETQIQEQGYFQGESLATDLPGYNTDYYSVNYKFLAQSTVLGMREFYMTISDNFYNYRQFVIKMFVGEVDGRNTRPLAFSCRLINK